MHVTPKFTFGHLLQYSNIFWYTTDDIIFDNKVYAISLLVHCPEQRHKCVHLIRTATFPIPCTAFLTVTSHKFISYSSCFG